MGDADGDGGTASGHYVHHDSYVAQCFFARHQLRHIDIGSRVDGFVARVAAFREIEYFDLRSVETAVPNIGSRRGNLFVPDSQPERVCDSYSCLHVIEHAGLGHYGDRLRPDGWRIALHSLVQVLSVGGIFYLSVPIGRQRVECNAHRVFAPDPIVRADDEVGLVLERLTWEDDGGAFHHPAAEPAEIPRSATACDYNCDVFELRQTRLTPVDSSHLRRSRGERRAA